LPAVFQGRIKTADALGCRRFCFGGSGSGVQMAAKLAASAGSGRPPDA